jgi:hypothetical protein
MSRSRPTVIAMFARYPGTAVDGTRVQRGARIAWCRATRRVLSADPARVAALVAGAKSAPPTRADGVDASERHLSSAWQEEQHSARWESNYGPGYDPYED